MNTTQKIASLAAAVAMLALPAASALAATFGNGSFEDGTAPGSFLTVNAGGTDITGWTVDSGSVDYIGTYWQAADGTRSIDLNGTEQGSLSQTFDTVPGATYTVTFSLSGNPDSRPEGDPLASPSLKDVRVSATGGTPMDYTFDTSAMGNTHENMMWQPKTYSFIASSDTATLTFASQIAGAFGPALDNVVVTETPPAPVASCPAGTVQNLVDTVTVNAASSVPTPSNISLQSGKPYLVVASGMWQNSNINAADAEYTSTDNWTTIMDGYNISPFMLGEGAFDLQVNNAFVNWGSYSTAHQYSLAYTGTGAPASFLIFDGDSTATNPTPNPGWYGDNTGSLTVNIYSCDTPAPPPPAFTKNECMKGGWMNLTDSSGKHFKNQGDCVSYVATGGTNTAAGQ